MNKKAFTLTELLVVIVVVWILSTIWLLSYISYLWDARDAQRKSDLTLLWVSLKQYKQQRWNYPTPWNNFRLTFSSSDNTVAIQWEMNNDVLLTNLDKLPLDPKLNRPYIYSVTNNSQEYQLALTLENKDVYTALVEWDYKSVSRNILPSIVLAVEKPSTWYISINSNFNSFVLNEQIYNIVYSFEEPFWAEVNTTNLLGILNTQITENKYWQNISYRDCEEIEKASKTLGVWSWVNQYQVIDEENWWLKNISCSF